MKKIKNWTKWMYWFTFAVSVIAVYKSIDNFNDIMGFIGRFLSIIAPFLMGVLIAYLLYTPCKAVEKLLSKTKLFKNRNKVLSVFVVYAILIGIIIFIINILVPAISKNIIDLAGQLPSYYNQAMEKVETLPDNSIIDKQKVIGTIENLQQIDINKILNIETLTDYIKKAIDVATGIFNAFVTLIMSIYILIEREAILKFFHKMNIALCKKETAKRIEKYFVKTNEIFFRFISSQILDAFIVGLILSLVLKIMGVEYAFLLGIGIGILNIIPYFGAIIGVIIGVIITIFTGGVNQAIWFAIVATIIQQIDANVINPRIVGNALKLSPILVISSVTIGGAYFKVLGMFLAVPVVAVIKLLVNDYLEYRIEKRRKCVNTNN